MAVSVWLVSTLQNTLLKNNSFISAVSLSCPTLHRGNTYCYYAHFRDEEIEALSP